MKKMSRYTRTSRLLVLLMCALLLAGMLPTFGALGDAKSRTGRLEISLQTKTSELPKGEKVEYTLYKVGSAAPETTVGWKFDDSLSEHTKEIAGIIEAPSKGDLQAAVDKLAAVVTDKNKVETLDLSKGSATTKDLELGVYLGVLTQAPRGLTASASLFTIPAWNAGKTELLYDQTAKVKDRMVGDLTVSKAVVSPDKADHDKSFSFTVKLTKGNEPYKTNETFKTTVTESEKASAGAVTFKDGVATLNVQGDTRVTITDLPQGIGYTVTEVEAEGFHTTFSGATGTIGVETQTAAFTNTRTGEDDVHDVATITKVDENGKNLTGATFKLYDRKDLSKEIAAYTTSPFEIRTDDKALAGYLPPAGGSTTLYLVETVAPLGYKLERAIHEVTITATVTEPEIKGEKYMTITAYEITLDRGSKRLTIPNQPNTGEETQHDHVLVTKTGVDGSLNGAIFTLYDGDKSVKTYGGEEESGFYIDTEDHELANLLPLSDDEEVFLTLKETKAPTGYILPEDEEYSVVITRKTTTAWNPDHTKKITTTAYSITIEDEESLMVPNEPVTEEENIYNSVVIDKVDDNNSPLTGAVFTLYDTDNRAITTYGGANISSFTISTDDAALSKYLPNAGETVTLKLKETRAPSGYVLANDEYKVVLTATPHQRWNDNKTKLLVGLNYGITIDNLRSLTVENEPVPTTTPTPPTGGGGGGGGGGAPVPPAPTPAPTTDITVTKVWADNSNFNNVRPDSIDIRLYADGREVDKTPTVSKSGDNWTYTFTGLPKFDDSGKEISYTAREAGDVQYYDKSENGLTITNTLKKLPPEKHIDLYVKKTWVDDGNSEGKRPTYITVYLYRDGEIIEKVTITAATNWEYSFKNLDADNGYGHVYKYTIKEETVPGYYTRINDTDITNGLLPSGGGTPNRPGVPSVPGEPVEEIPQRGGTPAPQFEELTDEELEELFDMFGYGTPLYGMFGTGDQIPAWVWVCGALGILALTMAIVMGRKKSKSR